MQARNNLAGGISQPRRDYKDRLFRMIFREPKNALALFNALTGSNYADASELEIVTMEDVVYLGMKNDVAILVRDMLTLVEHQSTPNPNMPLRGLLYFAREYEGLFARQGKSLYSSRLVEIPAPAYFVLYNGTQDVAERQELHLSDAFSKPSPGYEWTAVVLNVNAGHNIQIMQACAPLASYAGCIARVKEVYASGKSLSESIDAAIIEYEDDPALGALLTTNRAEVKDVLLTEFDEELYERTIRAEAREDAIREGREEGLELGREQGLKEGREQGLELGRTQGLEEGRTQGLEEGREQGRQERRERDISLYVARLQRLGISDADIAAGLTEDFGLDNNQVQAFLQG